MVVNIKQQFKIYSLFILVIFSMSAQSSTVEEALEASKNNNDQEAVKIWTQLATADNAIAKYNLHRHYSSGKGVAKNKKLSDQWLIAATRSGLVQGYTSLNKKALVSGKGTQLTFNSGPLYWLEEQDEDLYTIQLASSQREESIVKMYDENHMIGKGGYYHYKNNDVDHYALIYGTYATVAEANSAIKELPKDLLKKSPWVRNIKSLKKISIKN